MAFKLPARRHFGMYDVSALPNCFTQKNSASLRPIYTVPFCRMRHACDMLTTGLRHELCRVNQTYNSLTTVAGVP